MRCLTSRGPPHLYNSNWLALPGKKSKAQRQHAAGLSLTPSPSPKGNSDSPVTKTTHIKSTARSEVLQKQGISGFWFLLLTRYFFSSQVGEQ